MIKAIAKVTLAQNHVLEQNVNNVKINIVMLLFAVARTNTVNPDILAIVMIVLVTD